MESKAADLSSTSEELGRVREDLAETKTQLHLAKDQLCMVEDFMKQVQASKQEDEQRWLFELDSAKRRLREYESTQSKHDVLVEQLRFANRSLTAEVAELKKDSACMGQLLEDESGKVEGIADRERALNFEKIDLKMQKQEIEAERQKLLIQIGANEKLSMELKEKQEEVDVELQHRITNIMENERLENSKKLQQCEKEIYEVNRSLATEQAQAEKTRKENQALSQECKVKTTQIQVLFEEKAQLIVEKQVKLESERHAADQQMREQQSQIHDLIEKVRNLEFSLESSKDRANDFEERYNQHRKEAQRTKEEAKSAYERQRQTEIIKDNLQNKYESEATRLRQQVQELTTEMEQLQLQQEYADQRRGEQERARTLHNHEMLTQQERISNKWKRELEKSANAYETLIAKMKAENQVILQENNHWRT